MGIRGCSLIAGIQWCKILVMETTEAQQQITIVDIVNYVMSKAKAM